MLLLNCQLRQTPFPVVWSACAQIKWHPLDKSQMGVDSTWYIFLFTNTVYWIVIVKNTFDEINMPRKNIFPSWPCEIFVNIMIFPGRHVPTPPFCLKDKEHPFPPFALFVLHKSISNSGSRWKYDIWFHKEIILWFLSSITPVGVVTCQIGGKEWKSIHKGRFPPWFKTFCGNLRKLGDLWTNLNFVSLAAPIFKT